VRVVLVVALVVAGLAAAPASGATAKAPTCADGPRAGTPEPGTTAAGVTRVDFTLAHRVAGRCRVLRTQVRFPSGAGSATALPLLLAVHGADGEPSRLAPLLDVWAGAGYVVAAPTFLKTEKDARGKALASEVAQQAADARFVIDELLDRATALRIDPRRIGVAGMSLGGMTVYGLISHTCCQDGRIRAAVVMAGVHDDFPDGTYVHQTMPVLLVQGDADVGYHHSRDAYPQLAPPKWFITLHGERHSPPFEVPRGAAAGIVDVTTTLFWNNNLRGDTTAGWKLVSVVAATKGKATLQRDLSSK
jgi:dienelactone hydrolase